MKLQGRIALVTGSDQGHSSLDEQNAAKPAITEKWDSVVGANVQP